MRRFYLLLLGTIALHAKPQGFDLQSGKASFKQGAIHQSSDKAIVHWKDFSVGRGETLRFIQPSRDAAILNRVTGGKASEILGSLKANGHVLLVNPNGVYVGGTIHTAGFIASTADLSSEDFLQGNEWTFSAPGSGKIVQDGTISCPSGEVYLIAREIEGTGKTVGHFVGKVAAEEVLIRPHKNQRVLIQTELGDLDAANPYEYAIRHEGKVETFTVKEEGGRVYLVADKVTIDGVLLAESGNIEVDGKDVHLKDNAHIDVSGSKGGSARIGNHTLTIDEGAFVCADGWEGDGGEVIIKGDDLTSFFGKISAQALGERGDGGFVEVSGAHLRMGGLADLRSKNGTFGELLLDPGSVTIVSGPNVAPPVSMDSFNDGWINAELALGSLTISTDDSTDALAEIITINGTADAGGAASVSWTATTTFTLRAGVGIDMHSGASIDASGGGGSVVFEDPISGRTAIQIDGGTVSTSTGSITFLGVGTASIPFTRTGINLFGGTIIESTSGTIDLNGNGLNGITALSNLDGVKITGVGTEVRTDTGSILLTGRGSAGGTSSDNDNGIRVAIGATVSITGATGSATLDGRGGAGDDFCRGIRIDGSVEATSSGSITLIGRGGGIPLNFGNLNQGIHIGGGSVTSMGGNITMTGIGLNNGDGILLSTATVTTTGSGAISMTGTPDNTLDDQFGVQIINCTVSTVDGDVTMLGNSSVGAGGGIRADTTGLFTNIIETTGTGAIDMTGHTLGSGAGDGNHIGIELDDTTVRTTLGGSSLNTITLTGDGSRDPGIEMNNGATISTVDADITVTGSVNSDLFAGTGPGVNMVASSSITSTTGAIAVTGTNKDVNSAAPGIVMVTSSTISSDGGITLTGTGGTGGTTAGGYYGIRIRGLSLVTSTTGPINLIGNGGETSAGDSPGIAIDAIGRVITTSGAITVTGNAFASGDDNPGVQLRSSGRIQVLGAGSLTLTGTGSAVGSTGSHGVEVSGGGSQITTALGGTLQITGNGRGSATTNCDGIFLASGGFIAATGTGTITVNGTGGINGNTTGCDGIAISGATSRITGESGAISLTGTGGGTTVGNKGIRIESSGSLTSTLGTITAMGTGGSGTTENDGIFISDAGTSFTISDTTSCTATGIAAGSGTTNRGVFIGSSALVETTGSGTLTMDGTGGSTGTDSYGALLTGAGTTIRSSGSGFVDITGRDSGGTELGMNVTDSALVTTTGTGGIRLTTFSDLILDSSASFTSTGSGTITTTAARDLFLATGFTATLDTGLGLFVAGRDVDISASTLTSSGPITFVVDNDFPTSPGIGTGGFTFGTSTITTTGELRIYTARQSQNAAAGETINGVVFVPGPVGVDTPTEMFSIYFPGGTYGGGAFTFYYKEPLPVSPTIPTAAQLEFNRDVAANLTQLADLLPVLRAPRIPYQFPNYHFSICTQEEEECRPDFSPYGSFIFEDDLYWIGLSP